MKPVEEAFASETFRRVVLPGIVLTVGLHPLLSKWLPRLQAAYGVNAVVLIIAEIIFLGLLISSAIQWIYYVYEGFRLPTLTAIAGRLNTHRVRDLQLQRERIQGERTFDELSSDEQAAVTRIYGYLCDFPLRRVPGGSVERYADRPTRLGNVIATYELYAETRYEIDGIHFWHHILNLAPESARSQFNEKYSFCESLVLASFASAVVGVLHLGILVGFGVGQLFRPLVQLPFGPGASALLAGFGVGFWFLFYRLALLEHCEVGSIFRSIVDAAMPPFLQWIDSVEAPVKSDKKAKIEQVTEYLKALNE